MKLDIKCVFYIFKGYKHKDHAREIAIEHCGIFNMQNWGSNA